MKGPYSEQGPAGCVQAAVCDQPAHPSVDQFQADPGVTVWVTVAVAIPQCAPPVDVAAEIVVVPAVRAEKTPSVLMVPTASFPLRQVKTIPSIAAPYWS